MARVERDVYVDLQVTQKYNSIATGFLCFPSGSEAHNKVALKLKLN
jgi:hypothetical protein